MPRHHSASHSPSKKKLKDMRFFREPFWNLNVYTVTGAILFGVILGAIISVYFIPSPPSKYQQLCEYMPEGQDFTNADYAAINAIADKTDQLLNISEEETLIFLEQQPCVSNLLRFQGGDYILNFTNDRKLLVTSGEHLSQLLETGEASETTETG